MTTLFALVFSFAHGADSPWPGSLPGCDRFLGNLSGYLHDPALNVPTDSSVRHLDGLVTDEGRIDDPDAVARGLARGAYLHGVVDGHAKLVRPAKRGILHVAGFEDRIPRRDRRYIRALGERGIYTTADEHFAEVLEMCAAVERHDFDRRTGRRLRDARGLPVTVRTWLDEKVKTIFKRWNVHPARVAHSRAAWLDLPDGRRRLVGGIIWTDLGGVAMGETMCMDRSVASGIGKLLLHDLLAELRAAGYPWLDVQEVQVDRLPSLWGAVELDRDEHLDLVKQRHAQMR